MLHRGVKFAHAVTLAFSALFSFLFLRSFEDQWTLGYDAVVQITQSRDTSTGRAVGQAVEAFARDHGVTVGRQQLDLEHPDRSRDLYLTPTGPRAEWIDSGYPAFSPGQATTTRPFSEVSDRDPRGRLGGQPLVGQVRDGQEPRQSGSPAGGDRSTASSRAGAVTGLPVRVVSGVTSPSVSARIRPGQGRRLLRETLFGPCAALCGRCVSGIRPRRPSRAENRFCVPPAPAAPRG